MVYNSDTRTLAFCKLRITDIRDCQRLHLPSVCPNDEEIEFLVKEHTWASRYKEFMKIYCDDQGRVRAENMTKAERWGFFKLKKRTKAKEIIVSQTD